MRPVETASIKQILCLGAHSDDIEIGAGGALLKLLTQNPGCEVYWAVFSGGEDREVEARTSAKQFLRDASSHTIDIANFRDSYFPAQFTEIKEKINEIAGGFSPDLIFTHYGKDAHQDHRLIHDLTKNAFRNHWILEYEIPKYDGDLANPSVFSTLSIKQAERKVEILMSSFASQHSKPWFQEENFWAMMRIRGLQCRADEGVAEGFYCRKLCL